ncbi:signal transduction histidine kinase [Sphaerotilus hippei]|uniref:histidine kinase n=1 Tax=Sphaerotilus hippei TaxID=744406 RepID=A0A318GWS6_9BURK|nr:ATP-binding protein [Sphaerotilus hippei]PXW93838.1 signal transduction histidine kinase [Sphaerotilus hippei]
MPDTVVLDSPPAPRRRLLTLLEKAVAALHPARWGALVLALVLVGAWATHWWSPAPATALLRMQHAQQIVTTTGGQALERSTTLVQLPFRQTRSLPPEQTLWFRWNLDLKAAADPRSGLSGVYFEQICGAARIWFNGRLMFERGRLNAPDAADCLEPILVALPADLLHAGRNQLDLQLAAHGVPQVVSASHAGLVSPVLMGDYRTLDQMRRHQQAFNVSATMALATVVACVGLAALGLGVASQLPYLGYFGAASLGWALVCALMLGATLPLPPLWTQWLMSTVVPPVAVAGMLFLLRYCGLRLSGLELSMALQCLVVPLSLLVAGPERLHMVAPPWFMILAIEMLVTIGAFLHRAWALSRPDFWVGATALMAGAVTLLSEWLLPDGPVLLVGKHAISVLLITMFAGMVWRMQLLFQSALQAAEQARQMAERRAHDVQADMEQNFGQMAELRVEQVTARERKRIAADLHDDLGAKLLTIVHTSESERIATLAREALEEMRLSVRGLTGRAVQLGDAIGDWRSEVMMRLSQGGVELAWDTPDDLLMSERALSARAYVQTTRILREAVSNVLKHSGGSNCEISIRLEANDFELIISDNGKGIPMELDGKLDRGHGMSTMKGRAKQLQGQCLVESGPGYGTTIRLTLPL